jgi:hypothetical protein
LKRISKFTFYGCDAMKSILLPPRVQILGNECFEFCVCLKSVTFQPDSKLRKIGARTFRECSSLTELIIPASVESIRDDCFDECGPLFPLSFAPPSRIRDLSLPRLDHACQAIPDAVERVLFYTNAHKSIASVLTFGRESKLQEIWSAYGQPNLSVRAFLQVSSPSLKGMRLRLEFDEFYYEMMISCAAGFPTQIGMS